MGCVTICIYNEHTIVINKCGHDRIYIARNRQLALVMPTAKIQNADNKTKSTKTSQDITCVDRTSTNQLDDQVYASHCS